MGHRHRVLLMAEAANPDWASVPLIGWSLSHALAKVTDAHLVTHVRNREAIISAGLREGQDFTSIDNESVAAPVWKLASLLRGGEGKGWTTLTAFSSLAYYSFEHEVFRQFHNRLASREFDLVHRITPLSPTHQSPIAKQLAKLRVPFVLGPLNGGVPWPKHFIDRQHAEREWLAHIRSAYKLMPGYHSTRRCSSAILVGSQHTRNEMPSWANDKCVYIPENGVDPHRFNQARKRIAAVPLRGAFVGRLVPYKGADLLLEAASEFLKRNLLKLEIVGDGPEKANLLAIAERLNIGGNVQFHGWVPHTKIQSILSECDFMALPSVREFGGGVVLEAMALGVTPIVADYAGPSELVDDSTGFRVSFSDRASLIEGLKSKISSIIEHPEILDSMGSAGRRKVFGKLTWDAKARQIVAVYDAVISGQKDLRGLTFF